MKRLLASVLSAAALMFTALPAQADVTVGLIMGTTGPTASLGMGYKKVFDFAPKEIAGVPVRYVFLDDAGDPSAAVRHMRKLVTEDNADIIIGSSTTPSCLAMADVANELEVPQICLAPVAVPADKNKYVFGVAQSVPVMVSVLVEHMKKNNVKTLAYIGYADGWGDLCWNAIEKLAGQAGINIVAQERFNRPDTSVAAQVLKIMAARPDAVFVGASSTPATLPHITLKERGFAGNIYHTHGILGPDFLRVGGAAVEGAYATSGPLIVADELADSNPIKKVALDFFNAYEKNYPQVRNSFAGYSNDSMLFLGAALPKAMAAAKPGSVEFRRSLRDGLEGIKGLIGAHAVYNLSPTDHTGVDERARVLVQVKGGAFRLVE